MDCLKTIRWFEEYRGPLQYNGGNVVGICDAFQSQYYWMQMLHTDTNTIASYLRRVDYYSHIKQKHDNRVIQIYS